MVDLVALRAELDKPAYANLSNADAAVAVMAASITTERVVGGAEIGRMWARRDVLGAARERSQRAALTPAQRATAWTAIEMVDRDGFAGLDPTMPAQRTALVALLDRFVTDTIMTAADRTATLALLSQARPGREVFGSLDENDVARARAL